MILHSPMLISSRLLPAIKVADCTISIKDMGLGIDHRHRYRYYLDFENGRLYTRADLRSGIVENSPAIAGMFSSLLAFLGACGESVNYATRNGGKGENADLFPRWVGEWCAAHEDELGMLKVEIEECPSKFIEET
jgi:hypothetical protein